MKYFKIKQNDQFIGVVSSNDFRVLQIRHHFLRRSNEQKGQFVEYEDKLYRDTWMSPAPANISRYEIAEISEISQQLYNSYKQAIIDGTEDEIIEVQPQVNNPVIVEEIDNSGNIADAKRVKIAALKKACHDAIEDGFDVGVGHYSLTDYDQRNIALLSSLIAQGYENVPYHMDNGPVEYYSASKFNIVAEAAARHIIYHTTYYNALKAYVNSLEDEQAILNVQYGDEIPYEYQTAVLRDF